MKPNEIFAQFAVFKVAMEGTDIPQAIKAQVAQEFLQSLPPKAYSASCPATRVWLECAVQAFIDQLKAETNAGTAKEETDTTGTKKERSKGKEAKSA